MSVAVLFARQDSIYKSLPGCDVWDIERDARKWPGGAPIVAHPPCRAWGRLRSFAKPRVGERELALWAVDQIRLHGGVLEHPAGSQLWQEKPLPEPGERDEWGGVDAGRLAMVVGASSRESHTTLYRGVRAFGAASHPLQDGRGHACHRPKPHVGGRLSEEKRPPRLAPGGKQKGARGYPGILRLLAVPGGAALRPEALT